MGGRAGGIFEESVFLVRMDSDTRGSGQKRAWRWSGCVTSLLSWVAKSSAVRVVLTVNAAQTFLLLLRVQALARTVRGCLAVGVFGPFRPPLPVLRREATSVLRNESFPAPFLLTGWCSP